MIPFIPPPISNELAYAGFDCTQPFSNAYYSGVHAITEKQYKKMIEDFFNPILVIPKEKEFKVSSFDFTKTPCINFSVHLNAEETIKTDNDEVSVEVKPEQQMTGKYSINFFRGLLDVLHQQPKQPFYFQFSKARNNAGELTLVMRVLTEQRDVVLYRGDLTNMYP